MYPVPVTAQTYAILMVAALYGWRLGTLTVMAWLGEAAIGMLVLAGGAGGLAVFAGPTAGSIFSWALITALVGWLAERGWNGKRPTLAFAGMLVASPFASPGCCMARRVHRARKGGHRGRSALSSRRLPQIRLGRGRPDVAHAQSRGVTVRLRAHHLLCILTYVGKCYSASSTANYDVIAGDMLP